MFFLLFFTVCSQYVKLDKCWPGMLAACCKPSSGASVVWMDTPLNGPGSYHGHKNGNRFKESYHSLTIPGCWIADQLDKRKTEAPFAATKQWSGAQGCEFGPQSRKRFFKTISSSIAMMLINFKCLFCPWLSHLWEYNLYQTFTSEIPRANI